jgi:hypothetical protein
MVGFLVTRHRFYKHLNAILLPLLVELAVIDNIADESVVPEMSIEDEKIPIFVSLRENSGSII